MLRSLQWLGFGVAIAGLTAVTETAAGAQTLAGRHRQPVSPLVWEFHPPLPESPPRSLETADGWKPSSPMVSSLLKQSDLQAAPVLQSDGVLEPGDAVFNDTILYDSHPLEGTSGQAVMITATSADFDTYLVLQDEAGNLLAENDDTSESETNAQILFVFPETGTYQVFVSSIVANSAGRYQLTVTPVPADSTAARESTANYHFNQGSQLIEQGNYEGAIAAFEKALVIYQETDNRYQAGYTINEIGHAYQELGDYATSLNYFKDSAEISLELGDYESAGYAQYFWGLNHLKLGNYEEALQIFAAATVSFDRLEATSQNYQTQLVGRAVLFSAIASVYHYQGDKLNELESQEQAVSLLRALPPNEYFVTQLSYLAQLLGQLGRYEESLTAYQETITASEALALPVRKMVALIGIGQLQRTQGTYADALETLQAALVLSQELDSDRELYPEFIILGEMGNVYSDLGEYELSLEYYQKEMAQAEAEGNIQAQITSLNNRSIVYEILGEYEQNLEVLESALELSRTHRTPENESALRFSEASTLQGLGSTYESLGQYEKALDYYRQAIEVFQLLQTTNVGVLAKAKEADALNGMALVYLAQEEYDDAIAVLETALEMVRELNLVGTEAAVLINLGVAYDDLGQYDRALEIYEQGLELSRLTGSPEAESTSLNNLGVLQFSLEQTPQAIDYFEQALVISEQIGDRVGKANILANLGRAFQASEQPELAILFYKQSINTYEEIRGGIRDLEVELQNSYADSIAETYRRLADLLLTENRVLEAQRVLDLLKVQELDEYLNNVRGNAQTASGIEYWQPEAEILARYQDLQADAIALGRELSQLNALKIAGDITAEAETRRQRLTELQTELAQQFNTFVDSESVQAALDQLSRRELRQSLALEELSGLRDDLAELDAVLFYPLILEDRLELIVTTPDQEPIHRTVEGVGREELNRAVQEFRQALDNPQADAVPPAQKLYQWLIEPIEGDLAAAGVATIIYSPDGALRYIPLAALHDGDRWLVERFRVNNITAESLTELTNNSQLTPRILAGAFANQAVKHSVRGQEYGGLWFAGQEVEQLAQTAANITPLFDEGFDLATVTNELGSANVLHFATHADFVPGDPEASFILFGNGDTLTLEGIRNLSLANIDLVVLSACETGLGGYDNNGEQILGLGYQFQTRGAKAVIASLWTVDDGGTQALMTTFYSALDSGLSKAEALRQAQLAMLTGNFATVGGDRGGIGIAVTESGTQLRAGAQLSHPYYWAPFILIGNGL